MTAAVGQQRPRAGGWLQPRSHTKRTLGTWVLTLVLVLYLAFDSGVDGSGYAITAYAPVSIVVWLIVAVWAAWGLLPILRRSDRPTHVAILLFAGFTAWTALGITWSISDGRSLEDLALVSCYLGILLLAVQIHRERGEALRQTVAAVATAIVVIAAVAVASRLWPHLFSGSQTATATSQALAGSSARLSWPLGYWNGLAALMAIGLPLLLGLATSARSHWARSASAAGIPVLALCAALTQSRGGLVEAFVGVAAFIALAPQRVTKLITCAITACGSALLVAYGLQRSAIKDNLSASHSHQAWMVALAIAVICACVGLAQAGADRMITRLRLSQRLSPPLRQARRALIAALVMLVVVALAAHGPAHISHAWDSFKSASGSNTANHYASSGGEGRYQFWTAGIDSARSHPFTGSGPGTFQLDYLPRATVPVYTTNAHSLYVETYAELGLVGVLLLLAFLITALGVLVRHVMHSRAENRVRAAATAAALAAFLIGAAIDWLWQLPSVMAAVLLLVGAGLARDGEAALRGTDSHATEATARRRWPLRALAVVVSLACVLAAVYPLVVSHDVTSSSNALNAGDTAAAIRDARSAVALESGSAAAQLQLARSLGDAGRYRAGLVAARAATLAEPQGWSNWYLLGLLYADLGRKSAAQSAYMRAQSLNPQSHLPPYQ